MESIVQIANALVVLISCIAILLWWLLDRSRDQRSTAGLVRIPGRGL